MQNSLVTVVVMTYNHRDYIEQTMKSILNQKVKGNFDILVHDDNSDDGTYEYLMQLQDVHKDKINIIRQKTRKYHIDGLNLMLKKYILPKLNSKYVAYCDGDDYWIDDYKLQKQIDFMEHNDDYSMCFHNAYQLREKNDFSSKWFIQNENDIFLSDIISENPGVCIATSSIFIRTKVFGIFPNWRTQYPVEDVPLFMVAALSGKIHRLPDIMCVYRQFSSGSWSEQNKNNDSKTIDFLNKMINAVEIFDLETKRQYHNLVKIQEGAYLYRIALLEKNLKFIFDKNNKRYFKRLSRRDRISLTIQYRLPRLYSLLRRR